MIEHGQCQGIYSWVEVNAMTNGDKVEPAIAHITLPGICLVMPFFEQTAQLWIFGNKRTGTMAIAKGAYHPDNLHRAPERCPIQAIEPSVLIGVSTIPKSFHQGVVREMTRLNERPIVFALSNPTSKAECTAEQAVTWSDGRAIVATGSPFAPVVYKGVKHRIGQCNNAFIFPGLGFGGQIAGDDLPLDHVVKGGGSVGGEQIAERGALVQITAGSLLGDFGKTAQKACEDFFRLGIVHAVSSDAHSVSRRPPRMAAARARIRKKWGVEAERGLFVDNPEAILASRPVPYTGS